jgi:hypothetical protein
MKQLDGGVLYEKKIDKYHSADATAFAGFGTGGQRRAGWFFCIAE